MNWMIAKKATKKLPLMEVPKFGGAFTKIAKKLSLLKRSISGKCLKITYEKSVMCLNAFSFTLFTHKYNFVYNFSALTCFSLSLSFSGSTGWKLCQWAKDESVFFVSFFSY